MDRKYCPDCGFEYLQEMNSTLYQHCFVCVNCKKVFISTLLEVEKDRLNENYRTDRHSEIIKSANIKFAKTRVNIDQLLKLKMIDKDGNLKF